MFIALCHVFFSSIHQGQPPDFFVTVDTALRSRLRLAFWEKSNQSISTDRLLRFCHSSCNPERNLTTRIVKDWCEDQAENRDTQHPEKDRRTKRLTHF